jgi:methylase of polypeptide subunit release factors
MDPLKRKSLTTELQALVAEIAADLLKQLQVPGPARERAKVLHRDERVGDDFDVWLDLLSRRAAVLWVLKTVYVRVLEDRGFVKPIRLRDRESQVLFQHLAPGLADTAYLQWVFKDLASEGGLPELFAPQPAEVAPPGKEVSRKLLDFWRRTDEATQELRYRFDDEHFDGRLMGDLYQDLDPVVKERYALLQTPEEVVEFMLDEALTPATAEFGVETVRVLDPACGSGHFLLAAFKRLAAAMGTKYPTRPIVDIVRDVLARVVGIDLNDYACGLARARLVMTALESINEPELSSGATFHPQVFWADGLEQVERDEQLEMAAISDRELRATLTRPAVRKALRPVLKAGFHVVIANPPYITERDPRQRVYHRERVGGRRRYVSAARAYSLGNPFTERMFQLAAPGGFVADFNANSFMKREFGKPLVEQVLANQDLFKILDLGGARFDDYGTPTVLLFARNRRPSAGGVTVVMGRKADPPGSKGLVWRSCMRGHKTVGYEDEYVSIADCDRTVLSRHPWSLGGGGAADLKVAISGEGVAFREVADVIGSEVVTREDAAFVVGGHAAGRLGLGAELRHPLVEGDGIREWGMNAGEAIWPYDKTSLAPVQGLSRAACERALWRLRSVLRNRTAFGKTQEERGLLWFEYSMLFRERLASPIRVAFPLVATGNNFALAGERSPAFKHSVVVAVLSDSVTAFRVLGCLNSSIAGFWLKQVLHSKGGGGVGGGVAAEAWERFFEFDATKVGAFPIRASSALLGGFSGNLHELARDRATDSAASAVSANAYLGTARLRGALDARRIRDTRSLLGMVSLQEELDWLCYRLYGLDPDAPADELRTADQVISYRAGLRPFEITLALEDSERRAAIARGEEPDEAPTAWFERHGWAPATSLDELPDAERRILEARVARTAASRELSLIEQPTYKRRWYNPDYNAEEKEALETWLADRLEDWAKERRQPFTVEDAASALQADPAVLAVAEVFTGRPDFNLVELLGGLVQEELVPNQKHHVFKPTGLTKRTVWERTWEMQRAEDAAAKRAEKAPEPPAPPKYAKGDYLRDTYWSLRGALDVPKERFIALTEVPGRTATDQLYAWAGLTHRERAKMLVELDEQAERAGVAREDRIGLLHGIQFLADYVAWESEAAANEYRAAVTAVVGQAGITEQLLAEWAERHPPPQVRRARARTTRRPTQEESEES